MSEWKVLIGMPKKPKYPEIKVRLTGNDGNAFNVLGIILKAMRKGGVSEEEREKFTTEATSGDFDHLLRTAMLWVNIR